MASHYFMQARADFNADEERYQVQWECYLLEVIFNENHRFMILCICLETVKISDSLPTVPKAVMTCFITKWDTSKVTI